MSRRPVTRSDWRPLGAVSQSAPALPTRDGGLRSAAALAGGFAAALDRVVTTRLEAEARRAEREGLEAGRLAGVEDPSARMDPDTVRGAAFNRGAIESGARRLEQGLRAHLDELARAHATDPAALAARAGEYVRGMAGDLPDDIRGPFLASAETLIRPYVNQARDAQERAVADERIASFEAVQRERLAAMQRHARNVRDPAAQAALTADLEAMTADLVALGPRGGFAFRGRIYEPDPTRAGTLTLVQMERQLGAVQRELAEQAAMGAYEAGPRSAEWIEGWVRAARRNGVPGLDQDGIDRVEARMRADAARRRAEANAGRAEARAELNQIVTENLLAIAQTGEPTRPLDPGLIARAGADAAALAAREHAARQAFLAGMTARETTDPAALAVLAEQFQPGTPNFRADPQAAVRVLNSLRARGVEIAGAALAERVRDLEIEAAATGRAGEITEAEAQAAGITPERRLALNAELALKAEQARLRAQALRLPEGEREAALAALPIAGPEARENAARVQALAQALEQRDRAIAQDAAAYALAGLPQAAPLLERAAAGDGQALTRLAELARAEQERLGVPAPLRRALPKPIVTALADRILNAPGPDEAMAALAGLTQAVGAAEAARLIAAERTEGDAREPRQRAVAVAAALLAQRPDVARRIMAGTLFIRDNPLPAATPAERAYTAQAELGQAFELRPQALADAEAAALALYAARRDLTPTAFNARAFRQALAEVAPVTRFNGRATALPAGMDEDTFHAIMTALPPERLDGAVAADGRPITPAMIARGAVQAVAVGAGRYVLRVGAWEVQDARRPGEQFVLDIGGLEPPRRR